MYSLVKYKIVQLFTVNKLFIMWSGLMTMNISSIVCPNIARSGGVVPDFV